jgi:serine phosphatase RsbU (regulator of sigma subunit)
MSILGITALNEIVNNHRVTTPSEVLGYLRASVIDTLSQNDPDHLHKDGMDIGVCVYNFKTRELQFAGARIPLWIIANEKDTIEFKDSTTEESITNNGYSLTEIKGDIMPVGLSPKMEPFDNKTFMLKGDSVCIYLATDGFADQFGQKEKTKFSSKRLKNLLLQNVEKPHNLQEQILDDTFEGWKGMEYQIDDVTILGIKL